MRIVLASALAWPRYVGGGEVHTRQLAREFHARGHEVSFLTFDPERSAPVRSHREMLDGIPYDHLSVPDFESPYHRSQELEHWADAWLGQERPDIIHLFGFGGMLGLLPAAQRRGIPVAYTALEFSYFCRQYTLQYENRIQCTLNRRGRACEECALQSYSPSQRAAARLARVLPLAWQDGLREGLHHLIGADYLPAMAQRGVTELIERQRRQLTEDIAAIIAPSTLMRDFFIAQGVDASRIHFVHYGTDVQPAAGVERGESPRGGGLRLGFVGRPDRAKGIHLLCEAVRLLPSEMNFEVAIYSAIKEDSSDYAQQVRQAVAGDSRLQLMGPVSREGLPKALAAVDALVVPSIWYENSPIVITEALACGIPVICSDSPGNADLVHDGVNGLTFKLGDVGALAQRIARLVGEPALRNQLRQGVRPPPTTGDVAGQLLALYASLTRTNRGPVPAAC
jgi:glycosyltransferase involved in cell wall biosynthesis